MGARGAAFVDPVIDSLLRHADFSSEFSAGHAGIFKKLLELHARALKKGREPKRGLKGSRQW